MIHSRGQAVRLIWTLRIARAARRQSHRLHWDLVAAAESPWALSREERLRSRCHLPCLDGKWVEVVEELQQLGSWKEEVVVHEHMGVDRGIDLHVNRCSRSFSRQ